MKARLALILVAAAVLVPAGQAATSPAAGGEYIPFVTDFPKYPAAKEKYIPFVTDFPHVPVVSDPVVEPAPGSPTIDWALVSAGMAVGGTLLALLSGWRLAVARRARPARA